MWSIYQARERKEEKGTQRKEAGGGSIHNLFFSLSSLSPVLSSLSCSLSLSRFVFFSPFSSLCIVIIDREILKLFLFLRDNFCIRHVTPRDCGILRACVTEPIPEAGHRFGGSFGLGGERLGEVEGVNGGRE